MKILIFGKNGQVGWELQRSLLPIAEIVALDYREESGFCADLSNLEGIAKTIQTVAPDFIVNAAAYTAVDRAEIETEKAWLINSKALELMADEAKKLGACLIHFSSDYVFSGEGTTPWKETDKPNPLNFYGKSKLGGEEAIINSGCSYLIFRTSWVYGLRGSNFIKTILNLAKQRESLNIVSDQRGVPTDACLIADVTAQAIRAFRPELSAVYHLVPQGKTSWFDYSRLIIDTARIFGGSLSIKTLNPLKSEEYNSPAKRPLNSCLDNSKLQKTFALFLPNWELGVKRMLWQFLGQNNL